MSGKSFSLEFKLAALGQIDDGQPGLMRSISIPRRSHQTDRRLSPSSACALANGTPLSVRIVWAVLAKQEDYRAPVAAA